MKQYYRTAQPDVFFDPLEGVGFVENSPAHVRMLAEVKAGAAELVDAPKRGYVEKRLQGYQQSGLSTEAWLEAVIEFLGTLPNPPAKFAALWAQREAVRASIPKV